jgi:hypothetical protein
MAQEGTFSEKELRAVATDRKVAGEYAALRQCDAAFKEMIDAGQEMQRQLQQQQSKKRGHSHGHQGESAAGDGGAEGMAANEVKYVGYVDCVSSALCPASLKEWYSCLEQAKAGERPVESCEVVKHMLERCLRAETDALFRASQAHVFRSTQ